MNATAIHTSAAPLSGPPGAMMSSTTTYLVPQNPTEIADLPSVWALPHRPESAGTARRITRCALGAWGIDEDTTDQVLLVVSELVTNAVEHALPPVALHLDLPSGDGTIHVEVDDGGPAAEEGAWTASCGAEEHGRGSGIIDFLTTAHGTHTHAFGATHWARLPAAA
ncbi:ATP-binding protein [Streptomyces sp. NPDC002659]|uniref:ATP-binding protein n=1 Tax=Streptomyces sp. NPDC002659 TaxID=3364656 RepID=UPI00367B4F9A